MAKWQRKISLKDVWDGEDIPLIASTLAARLKALKPFGIKDIDEKRDELADEFDSLARETDADNDSFNDLFRQLYDWADTKLDHDWNGKKVCWIATSF